MKTTAELKKEGKIAIVGAGPAGLTLARIMSRDGFDVTVYERDASSTARSQGGSLDLRPDSGQQAITAAGLMEEFTRHSRSEAKAFKLVDSQGVEQPGAGQETHEDAGPEIDRGDLRQLLIDALPKGMIAWGHTLKTLTRADGDRWILDFENQASVTADLVVGADGIGSKVRKQLTSEQPRYTGITMLAGNIRKDLWRGSKISEMLGEGSVMFAGGEKTIFVQRCNHDLILLYYSMKVQESWPASSGFELTDKPAVLTSIKQAFQEWSPQTIRDADGSRRQVCTLARLRHAARLHMAKSARLDDAWGCRARHAALHWQRGQSCTLRRPAARAGAHGESRNRMGRSRF